MEIEKVLPDFSGDFMDFHGSSVEKVFRDFSLRCCTKMLVLCSRLVVLDDSHLLLQSKFQEIGKFPSKIA
jgi:hypothetical protein